MNLWTGPRFGPALKRIVRLKRAGALRFSGQTDSGQLVSVKSAGDGPRLGPTPGEQAGQLMTTQDNF